MKRRLATAVWFMCFGTQAAAADWLYPVHTLQADRGMIVTDDPVATAAGQSVLQRGGTAVDAAVAAAYMLTVTRPDAASLGGGGVMTVYTARNGKTSVIDFREKLPEKGAGLLGFGVPGVAAGLDFAALSFGTSSTAQLATPARNIALKGTVISAPLAAALDAYQAEIGLTGGDARKIFLKKDGTPYKEGEKLWQPELGRMMDKMLRKGARETFYSADFARSVQAAGKNAGSGATFISAEDFAAYQPALREPLTADVAGVSVSVPPPPVRSGLALLQTLGMLSHVRGDRAASETIALHARLESLKIAMADGRTFAADPDQTTVPTHWLTSALYSKRQETGMSLESALPTDMIEPGRFLPQEDKNAVASVTHHVLKDVHEVPSVSFAAIDKQGNMVAGVLTLSAPFGSRLAIPGTGILLGAAGGNEGVGGTQTPNGARPAWFALPVMVTAGNKPIAVLVSPSNADGVGAMAGILTALTEEGKDIGTAVARPRLYQDWPQKEAFVEDGIPTEILDALMKKGHTLRFGAQPVGCVHGLTIGQQGLLGVADGRCVSEKSLAGF